MSQQQTGTRRLLIISAVVDLGLGLLKIFIGLFAHSYALVIDGIHSLSDLVTDLMVWVFHEIGSSDPDEDHPYGHAKFETFGTLLLGALLIGLALYLVLDVFFRVQSGISSTIPTWPALIAALVSIGGKEWLYRITLKQGRETKSKLLQANAWHHRTDALSSVIVLIGVGAAIAGFAWLELVAAIIVAIMIALIGWNLCRQSMAELVDTSLSKAYIDKIREEVTGISGVVGVHSIRTRRMGSSALVDIHLQVNARISVSEGHHIGEWVTHQLAQNLPEINDVVVHIDPEDDEFTEELLSTGLAPLRHEVIQTLQDRWQALLHQDKILSMHLHYLTHRIEVELILDANHFDDPVQLLTKLKQHTHDLDWLADLKLYLR